MRWSISAAKRDSCGDARASSFTIIICAELRFISALLVAQRRWIFNCLHTAGRTLQANGTRPMADAGSVVRVWRLLIFRPPVRNR